MSVCHVGNLYARFPPKLLFEMDNGEMETVLSRTGVQQGCNLGPLCLSAGGLTLLQKFRANPPVERAEIYAYIDDIVVNLPPERASDMKALSDFTTWLQRQLGDCGITLNRHKSGLCFQVTYDTTNSPQPNRPLWMKPDCS